MVEIIQPSKKGPTSEAWLCPSSISRDYNTCVTCGSHFAYFTSLQGPFKKVVSVESLLVMLWVVNLGMKEENTPPATATPPCFVIELISPHPLA